MSAADISKALEPLESHQSLPYIQKKTSYTKLIELLKGCNRLDEAILTRCLKVAAKDLANENLQYAMLSAKFTLVVLENIKVEHFKSSLIATELRIVMLKNIKILCLTKKLHDATNLTDLCIQMLVDCPEHVMLDIACYHDTQYFSLLETFFDLYTLNSTQDNSIVENVLCMIIKRTINSLSENKKIKHIERGLATWFKYILPYTMHKISLNAPYSIFLDVWDVLIEDLQKIDYSDDPNWLKILEDLGPTAKYPKIIETVLTTHSGDEWDRIWCILIKLIKIRGRHGSFKSSSLNNMLCVVDKGLKSNTEIRIRSFRCWNVLIDCFIAENDETLAKKRLNLLMVPMRINNAKVESVAIQKFNTWWHLIRSFNEKIYLSGVQKDIIIPFLHYCFGDVKQNNVPNTLYAGTCFSKVRQLGMIAFTHVVGHCDNCCCNVPEHYVAKSPPLLRASLLVDNLSDWKYFLQSATKYLADLEAAAPARKQVNCIWKSCFRVVASMSDNGIRRDLAEELFNVLARLFQIKNMSDMIFDVMIATFFAAGNNIETLLTSDDDKNFERGLIRETNTLLLNYYKDNSRSKSSTCLQNVITVVKTVLLLTKHKDQYIKWLMQNVSQKNGHHEGAPLIWTALTHAVYETQCSVSVKTMLYILMWPIKELHKFSDTSAEPAIAWNKIYGVFKPRLTKNLAIDSEILKLLVNINFKPVFIIYIVSTLLKAGLITDKNNSSFETLLVLLSKNLLTIADIQECKHYENIFPDLTECLIFIMKNKLTATTRDDVADNVAVALSSTLKLIAYACKSNTQTEYENNLVHVDILLSNVNTMYINKPCMKTKSVIADAIIECSKIKAPHIKAKILMLLKELVKLSQFTSLNNTIGLLENGEPLDSSIIENKKLPTLIHKPNLNNATKETKKIIENGEEFVVLETNYRFDPNKLTEHQKEKLRNKRDIPALYQDLSQSQDVFTHFSTKSGDKLNSLDMSCSNSNSLPFQNKCEGTPNQSVTTFVNNPHDVIDLEDNSENVNTEINMEQNDNNNKTEIKNNDGKSPRISLKDRVMMNSDKLCGKKKPIVVLCSNDISTNNQSNLITNRPCRSKRMPKKYVTDDNYEYLFTFNKKNCTTTPNIDIDSNHKQDADVVECDLSPKNNEPLMENVVSIENTETDKSKRMQSPKNQTTALVYLDRVQMNNDMCKQYLRECNVVNNESCSNSKPQPDLNCTPIKKIKTQRKSRETKNLSIDMVEGNPVLQAQPLSALPTRRKAVQTNKQTKTIESIKRRRLKLSDDTPNSSQSKTGHNKTKKNKNIKSTSVPSQEPINLEESSVLDDLPSSEDVIESSQDSTSIKSITVNSLENQSEKESNVSAPNISILIENNDTAIMDTEPILSDYSPKLILNEATNENMLTEIADMPTQNVEGGINSQDIATIDTEPINSELFVQSESKGTTINETNESPDSSHSSKCSDVCEDVTCTVNEVNSDSHNDLSSPFEDEEQRKTTFLNSTIDISPIRVTCPEIENNKTPSPDKSDEYVVITLSSPVHSDGEPAEKTPENDSAEPSPLKGTVSNPGLSYSFIKNIPRYRAGGRAALMMSLCQSERLRTPFSVDKDNMDQYKALDSMETIQGVSDRATVGSNYQSSDNEDNDDFLKFTRILPSADSSPSVPILKRKYDDITSDENAVPSASKRKRVSFHDPPVSTSISIEVYNNKQRSPQGKRPERRSSVQCVDSLSSDEIEDTTYKKNNVDPIFPDLMHCENNINVIASKLSMPDALPLLVKQFEGRITTVGDLAKLTELELHKLCIKSPKLTTTKIVLANYLAEFNDQTFDANTEAMDTTERTVGLDPTKVDAQTCSVSVADGCMQTDEDLVADVLTSISCTSRVIHSYLSEQHDQDDDPLNEMYRKELQEKVIDKLPLHIVTEMVHDKATTDSDRKLFLNEIISDDNGLELLETYLRDRFSSLDLVHFTSRLLQGIYNDNDLKN